VRKSDRNATVLENPVSGSEAATRANGNAKHRAESSPELRIILESLRTMRNGDFSVRLPGSWIGLPGKIADTFNDIAAANQHIAQDLERIGQVVGKEGKTR
jgi:hypothetical protein